MHFYKGVTGEYYSLSRMTLHSPLRNREVLLSYTTLNMGERSCGTGCSHVLLPSLYDSGIQGFPVPAAAIRAESVPTSTDTLGGHEPCGPPGGLAVNFLRLSAPS